jgi:hypothetical protein
MAVEPVLVTPEVIIAAGASERPTKKPGERRRVKRVSLYFYEKAFHGTFLTHDGVSLVRDSTYPQR